MTTSTARTQRAANDAAPERSWFRIANKAADTAEVFIYDEVGDWGMTAGDFAKELGEVTAKHIDLRLNTPGGAVFDGLAIYNALKRHPATVTVHVDGLAASIASVIAMAGDRIIIDRYAQMMIHEAHAIAAGSTKDMSSMAKLLDEYSDNIAAIYAERAGGTVEAWRDRMRAETWFSAREAVAAGLADEVAAKVSGAKVSASWDLSIFNYAGRANAPDPLATIQAVAEPEPAIPAAPAEPEPVAEPDPVAEPAPTDPAPFDPEAFRSAMARAAQVDFDPQGFRELMQSVAGSAPAPPPTVARMADLGPLPQPDTPPEAEPEPGPWDTFRTAMRMAADDAPAPPEPTKPENPAQEPGFLMDADAFRTALRRATL